MKIALVTGGTRGIGRGISMMLLKRGFFVYATYSSDDESARSCSRSFSEISSDFSIEKVNNGDYKQLKALTDKIRIRGSVRCIVFNAGCTLRKPLSQITNEEWECSLSINLNSNVYIIRDLMDSIAPESRLIFIGSMMGILPHAMSLSYGVSKAAVHALAKNLVKEFDGTGTTVNVIAPGFVETEWQKNKPENIRANICAKTALHRFADVDEVVKGVEFCMDNQFVNGSIIEIDGGYCYK